MLGGKPSSKGEGTTSIFTNLVKHQTSNQYRTWKIMLDGLSSKNLKPLNNIQIQGKLTLRWNTGQRSESESQPQYYVPPSKLLKSSYKHGLRTFPAREIHPRMHTVRQCDPHKAYSHKLRRLWCHRAPPLHINPTLVETQFKYTSVWILHSCSNSGHNTLLILNQIVSYWMPSEIQFF